jgi:hypothetical protein
VPPAVEADQASTHFRSFAEQSRHYFFDRPHDGVPEGAVGGPAAWRAEDVAKDQAWRSVLDSSEREEIQRAVGHARSTGRPTGDLRPEDFPIPLLAAKIAEWRRALVDGLGFHVVSGVPVEGWSAEECEAFFWCIGLHMGWPGAQNPNGHLLGHVTDTGAAELDPLVRLYQTAANIAPHCDAADVVGLLCVRPAPAGGASRIASSVAIFDEILRRDPDLASRLFEPFALDIRNEDGSGTIQHLPIPPCRFGEGRLRTFYHSDYFRSATRHADVGPLPPRDQALLDLYEEIAADPAFHLEMDLAAGDIQWLSNHTIVHARTAYEDHRDPAQRRHLLRLWLSL